MSWFFKTYKFQQNIFIFVSVSLIFCSKKYHIKHLLPLPPFLKQMNILAKIIPPPFVRTTLNSMQNLSSLVLNFFMRNFYWNSCTLKNFRRLYQICIHLFIEYFFFIWNYIAQNCIFNKNVRKEKKSQNCIVIFPIFRIRAYFSSK